MSHIFVSYSRKDLTFVTQLVNQLQQAGLPVWFDQISIQPGDIWEAAIEQGLRKAIAVAVVISPDSMASEYVRKEVNFAQESDQRLLPILYRPAQLFLNLQTIQWVDLSSEAVYPTNLRKLIDVLNREPGLSSHAIVPAESVSADDTRTVSPATLQNYLHVAALIAGQHSTWRRLAGSIGTAGQLNAGGQALALSRLNPPTPTRLASTIAATPSIQILHLICRTENDMFVVENEHGRAAHLTIDELARFLGQGAVKLLLIEGVLSAEGIQRLLWQSSVQAIITVTPSASEMACRLFEEHFYAALALGQIIQIAYQMGLNAVGPDERTHFGLTAKFDAVKLDYPPVEKRAMQPIIDPGLPPMRNVPIHPDFVGQGQPLLELGEKISPDDTRQVMIHGLGGIGKSWLASEFVVRFGWRFSDGVVWVQVSEQTRAEDIFNQVRLLLGLPLDTALTDLVNILRQRRVLVVLDQVNEWGDRAALSELATFVSHLEPSGGTRVMLTSWGGTDALVSGAREMTLLEMQPADAEALTRQLIIDHDLASEFEQNALLGQFVEATAFTPWLIKEGIRLARLDGAATALEDLAALAADTSRLFERYVGTQYQKLAAATQSFLRRLQGLPDGFDRRVAQAIDSQSREHLRTLIQHQLLRREGVLYLFPPTVRLYLRQRYPLSEADQDTIDQAIIHHWLETGGGK